jgi:glutamate-ammonia-ligase adenylyltransferase
MSRPRVTTPAGRLARLGYADSSRAESALRRIGEPGERLALVAADTADPDQAIGVLADLADRVPDREQMMRRLVGDRDSAARLLCVLGASPALGEHLLHHPEQWSELGDPSVQSTRPTASALRGELVAAVEGLPDGKAVDALRVSYRRVLLRLAARDLAHDAEVDDVAAELSDLADATLEAALVVARARVGDPAQAARLAVIAMGKCGGHELNYVSDVDVVFAVEPANGHDEHEAVRVGTLLAANLINICSEHTGEGAIWPVDAALRPEGKAGPLVRTVASHERYYAEWAKTWEFQALLKARPVAGDTEVGSDYVRRIRPLVWAAADRDGFVADVQTMRRRVVDNIPPAHAGRQIKLGAGGLRDIEFAVQLLQLVHGRTDPELRSPTTLTALAALTSGGYVGRDDGAALDAAYRFLRRLEHRMQLTHLRPAHVLPGDEPALRRLGRSMGFLKHPVDELDRQWGRHSREVRRLHEKLFYRPLLAAVARLPGDEARLTPEAAGQRLAALGYDDPAAALRHIEALTAGVTRTASIQRALLPAMLGWFADAPNPDAGLLAFRQLSESLGPAHWYLQTLRDEGYVAQQLATVLASSRFAAGLLQRAPEGVQMLAEEDGLAPPTREPLEHEMTAAGLRHDDPTEAVATVRAIRRRELFRVAVADLLGRLDVERVGHALSDVTAATLAAGLEIARAAVRAERRGELPVRVAVVAVGRLGGAEMGYGSDADVMFVQEPAPGADGDEAARAGHEVALELRRLLALPGTDPALQVDAGLRPEGRQGPLVRTLYSYAAYYADWSSPWEAQALLRARPVAGDPELCQRFTDMVDPLRFPAAGIADSDVREIRRIKARVDAERLPRGADPATHLKLGRGGLSDVEWTVQLLQLRYAGQVPGLRTTRTLAALEAAAAADVLPAADADALAAAWRAASGMRNAIMLVRGRAGDSPPTDPRERAAVAHVLGYPPGESDALVNDYLRAARRARRVVERVFWG